LKELNFFIYQSIKLYPTKSLLNALIEELPMLLELKIVDLNEFFNVSKIEN